MTTDEPRTARRDADAAPDLADALAIIDAQRARAEDTRPSGALLFGLWGAAWLVGYGALWLTARDDGSAVGARRRSSPIVGRGRRARRDDRARRCTGRAASPGRALGRAPCTASRGPSRSWRRA